MKYIILETLFHWTCTAPLLYTPMDWFWAICEVSLIYLSLDYLRRRIKSGRDSNCKNRNKKRKI